MGLYRPSSVAAIDQYRKAQKRPISLFPVTVLLAVRIAPAYDETNSHLQAVITQGFALTSPPAPSVHHADIHSLYLDHHAWLLGWLRKRLRHADNAADLAHDTFVHLLGKRTQLQEVRQPRAWLSVVARGLLIDRVRRQRVEKAYLEAIAHLPEAEMPSPESQLILLETLARIDAVLDGLAPKVRNAFLLSRLEGLGYKEIAERLNVSLSSVEKYMATAIRHCFLAQQ